MHESLYLFVLTLQSCDGSLQCSSWPLTFAQLFFPQCIPQDDCPQVMTGPGLPSCPAEGRTCCWAPRWVLTGRRKHLRSDWALVSPLILQQCSQREQQDHRSHLLAAALWIRCFPQALLLSSCAHSIPESCSPPRAPPQWVQAHNPSLLPLIATKLYPCALMSEDLRQRLAQGIYTAVKNESATLTRVTQRQQQLCRDPWEVFTKNWASQQDDKRKGYFSTVLHELVDLRGKSSAKHREAQKQPAYDCGQQLRLLFRIEVRHSMFAPHGLWTPAKLNSTSNFGTTSLAYCLLEIEIQTWRWRSFTSTLKQGELTATYSCCLKHVESLQKGASTPSTLPALPLPIFCYYGRIILGHQWGK